ncbi:MAG: lectin like domain-containing protein [Lachnospiraceae bacterium]|nr:lectin like domain-containing protein [Lachnospiraceae bacterium]
MNHLRKIGVAAICALGLLMSGCAEEREEVQETVTELTEIPSLPAFVLEPERTTTEIELPEAYNYIEENRMPLLKNQGDTNTCWAFASLSALESSMDEDAKESYSADHLIYHNPFNNSFEDGGSYVVTMAYLLSWNGPVRETEDPFDGESPEGLEPCVRVQEIRQSAPKDYEAIKRFIYLYGGVESALYVDFDESMLESSYYNKEFSSYCYQGDAVSNHDIVIIGWDDTYPAENFVGEVQNDGAFIALSSWGEEFGDRGTFYVSYEDVNIGGYGIVYSRIDTTDNYDKIYQADLCGFTAQIGYQQEECWFANVYTAEEAISLKAAGFYATGKNTEYTIYVVPEFTDASLLKYNRYICNGFLEDAGYYTIDFPEAVSIEAGNEFAIVVKIKTENAEYPVAIECPVEGLSEEIDITDGEGYLSLQGTRWEHIEETKNYNICLKGYADIL